MNRDDRRLLAQIWSVHKKGWTHTVSAVTDGVDRGQREHTFRCNDTTVSLVLDADRSGRVFVSVGHTDNGPDAQWRPEGEGWFGPSLRQVLDALCAFGVLAPIFSPTYRDGSRDAQVATERRLHEHYSKQFEREFGQTYAYVLDLAEFVDHEHEFRSATGCHPQPGVDCVDWCEACGLLADLSDEARAELDQRKAVA